MGDRNELLKKFSDIETSEYSDFDGLEKPLDRGLWVLWVAKASLGEKKLTAEDVASIIRDVKEVSIEARAITNAFNRAGNRVHIYRDGGKVQYEIMKTGKDYLLSQASEGSVDLLYFEPEKKYTAKRILSRSILRDLKGELAIVDPYCGVRTLDMLKEAGNRPVRFLTRIENLKAESQRKRLLREIRDFRSESPNVEFRSYPKTDIHDRYIISSESLVLLGHSIKDLGGKESFAIVLDVDANRNTVQALIETFNRRWKQSNILQ
jgi:hypothetical protein